MRRYSNRRLARRGARVRRAKWEKVSNKVRQLGLRRGGRRARRSRVARASVAARLPAAARYPNARWSGHDPGNAQVGRKIEASVVLWTAPPVLPWPRGASYRDRRPCRATGRRRLHVRRYEGTNPTRSSPLWRHTTQLCRRTSQVHGRHVDADKNL